MTYALVKNGAVGIMYQNGNPFTLNDIQYPANWLTLSTASDREAIDLYPVVYGSEADQRFYWVSSNSPTWDGSLKQVNISFTSTPKELAPLKTSWVTTERATAYSMLLTSDWMIVRAIENPAKPIPAEWTTYRAAVRTECERLVAAIESSTDIPSLITAINSAKWPLNPDSPPFPPAS